MQRLAHSRHRRRLTEEFLEDAESGQASVAQLRRASETSQGAPALHRAAGSGDAVALTALLHHGVALDTADSQGR